MAEISHENQVPALRGVHGIRIGGGQLPQGKLPTRAARSVARYQHIAAEHFPLNADYQIGTVKGVFVVRDQGKALDFRRPHWNTPGVVNSLYCRRVTCWRIR